ncbi:MAG: phosphatidylserine decarboxylase [Rickettsiaceae bacterium]|nr:phosphatidylserine decarboxylase [Rickettsiaceae bacterium]
MLKIVFVPIHKEGFKFIMIFAFVTIILSLMSNTLGTIGLVLTVWCVFFFRDPERFTPIGENLVISPADGVVNLIEQNATPPEELNLPRNDWTKISVFLNVFNVHVNRVPISGRITKVNYKIGKFLSANLEEASLENERNSAIVNTKDGKQIVFVQVAGLVARRIVSDLKEGQEVQVGDRYGIIRFGSRADIYLPKTTKLKVMVGQTMIGGETVIAEL